MRRSSSTPFVVRLATFPACRAGRHGERPDFLRRGKAGHRPGHPSSGSTDAAARAALRSLISRRAPSLRHVEQWRRSLDEGGAPSPPIDALHLLYDHEARSFSAGQPHTRPERPLGSRDRARDQQTRPKVEFAVGQDQCGPVLRLLVTRLGLEIYPGQIAAVRMVGRSHNYQTSFPTGGPQSTLHGPCVTTPARAATRQALSWITPSRFVPSAGRACHARKRRRAIIYTISACISTYNCIASVVLRPPPHQPVHHQDADARQQRRHRGDHEQLRRLPLHGDQHAGDPR
jgi:hypothetical protein